MTKPRATFAALALLLAMLVLALAIPILSGGGLSNPADTPEPTDAPKPITVGLTPYENNPVLIRGTDGTWDVESVFSPHVVFKDGTYHMFYSGTASPTLQPIAIGYATSPDGLSFARHTSNPILEGDGSGFDALQVTEGVPLVEGDTWVLYYNAGSQPGPGPAIGRATAPAPTGPWTRRDDPVLVSGGPGEWDSGFVMPNAVIATDEGYVMYYTGGASWQDGASAIGMATSPDGISWTKYDDPATPDAPVAASDPVIRLGTQGSWDASAIWSGTVRRTTDGWEMFYTGSDAQRVRIGHAASVNGIYWTKDPANPVLDSGMDPLGKQLEYPILQTPSIVVNGATCILYYDYGIYAGSIGAATGVLSGE